MKVLRPQFGRGSERYRRFEAEIRFLRSARAQRRGVIRLIDSYLPASPGEHESPWLAMPVGEAIEEALGPTRSAPDVCLAVADFAVVLSELQASGVYHRDLKPANLLRVDTEWTLADFGLVAYPEKEDITGPEHGVGSRHYVAPEIERGEPGADLGLADVYSMAKTLWVLVSRQRYPYAGPHRTDEPVYNLSVQLDNPSLRPLDILLAAATNITPGARPTMAEFAADLRLFPRSPRQGAVTPDQRLSDVQKRIQDRTQLADAERDLRRERAARSREHLYRLRDLALNPSYAAFLQAVRSAGGKSGRAAEQLRQSAEIFERWGFATSSGRERYGLVAGIADEVARVAALSGFEIDANTKCRMSAALVVEVFRRETAIVWHDTALFIPGTAVGAESVETLATHLQANLAATLERYERGVDAAEARARPGRGDTTPPRVLLFEIDGSPLTLSGAGGVITFRARIADDQAGVADSFYRSSPSQARFMSPERKQFVDVLFQPGRNLADGDSYDGTYVEHVQLPTEFESGEWHMQYLQLVDEVGNSVVHEGDLLRQLGFQTSFTVT